MKALPAAVAVIVAIVCGSPATADDDDGYTGGTTRGGIFAGGTKSDDPASQPPRDVDPELPAVDADGPRIELGASACPGATQVVAASEAAAFCESSAAEQIITIGAIRNAFAELKLPAAKLVIQPPDGLTLVNFDTNFYTTSTRPISRTVTLLGQQVTLEATPAEFRWSFGDGESLATTKPGAPYPDLTITHNYLRKGTYRPSLDTVFTGRYRVGSGAWQQIPGTVTIEGAGQDLRAIEAQPKLVGY